MAPDHVISAIPAEVAATTSPPHRMHAVRGVAQHALRGMVGLSPVLYCSLVEHMDTNFTRRLGKRVKQLRTAQGLTHENLAELADMSASSLSRIENGREPRLGTLRRIAEALGVPIEALFQDEDGQGSAEQGLPAEVRGIAARLASMDHTTRVLAHEILDVLMKHCSTEKQ